MTKYEAARVLSDIWRRHSRELQSCLNEQIGTVKRDYISQILKQDLIALERAIELLDPERWERLQQAKADERERELIRVQLRIVK
jgi:hypothetical protein